MEIVYLGSFQRDLKRINSDYVRKELLEIIELIKRVDNLFAVPNVKKMEGTKNYYRIKLNEYRIGITWHNNIITMYRFLHRKEIYKYFP